MSLAKSFTSLLVALVTASAPAALSALLASSSKATMLASVSGALFPAASADAVSVGHASFRTGGRGIPRHGGAVPVTAAGEAEDGEPCGRDDRMAGEDAVHGDLLDSGH